MWNTNPAGNEDPIIYFISPKIEKLIIIVMNCHIYIVRVVS